MLTGNRGEWSELYVFLKLLADGKLYGADENLNQNPDLYYPIIKILREEIEGKKREYVLNGSIKVIDGTTSKTLVRVPVSKFLEISKQLFKNISNSSGRSFSSVETENFINTIDCHMLSDSRGQKEDITLIVHDIRTNLKPTLGFSIKSMLGGNSTLFNPGNTTNFVYKILHPSNKRLRIKEINSITTTPVITSRISKLLSTGFEIKFQSIESEKFQTNLELIDSQLPQILGYMLLYRYTENGGSKVSELNDILNKQNPLSFNLTYGHPFYEFKIKNFLTDAALGMTPSKIWTGKYDATGGIILVKENAELVCYHIYNRNDFQQYLFKNTRLEQASTTRYGFGNVFEVDGNYFLKLNLQVRFI